MYTLSIDQLQFETQVLADDDAERLQRQQFDGVLVDGLLAEGALWDARSQALDEPVRGRVLEPLPLVWFQPSVSLKRAGRYAMPLYTTTARFGVLSTTGLSTNYIMNLNLPSTRPESWWTLRGAACFVQGDD